MAFIYLWLALFGLEPAWPESPPILQHRIELQGTTFLQSNGFLISGGGFWNPSLFQFVQIRAGAWFLKDRVGTPALTPAFLTGSRLPLFWQINWDIYGGGSYGFILDSWFWPIGTKLGLTSGPDFELPFDLSEINLHYGMMLGSVTKIHFLSIGLSWGW